MVFDTARDRCHRYRRDNTELNKTGIFLRQVLVKKGNVSQDEKVEKGCKLFIPQRALPLLLVGFFDTHIGEKTCMSIIPHSSVNVQAGRPPLPVPVTEEYCVRAACISLR
jgi:hypothetical protein